MGGEPIGRAEVKVRVGKLKNGNAAGKDEFIGKIIKGGGGRVVDWMWRLYNMAFESLDGDLLRLFHCTRVKEREMNV